MGVNGVGGLAAPVMFDRRLMAYRSPWSPTPEVGEVYLLRGAILSAFSHADSLAMMLAVRSSMIAPYQLRNKAPTRREERISFLRAVAEADGPLAPYRGLLQSIANRLEALNEFRTVAAHASYSAFGHGTVSFPETKKSPGKSEVISKHRSMTLRELRRIAMKYALFSRACESLYYRLSELQLLPDAAFHRGWHSSFSGESVTLEWGSPGPPDARRSPS